MDSVLRRIPVDWFQSHQTAFFCCSDELQHSLSRSTGGAHFNKSEKQLLEIMKQLAVQYQNPAVHVQKFLDLVQQQDEGVHHFAKRLRGYTKSGFESTASVQNLRKYQQSGNRLSAGLSLLRIVCSILHSLIQLHI